jgi:sterol desaturase/sphingolipid hydroxylase (fatty acid hydroxylase superfamily)
MHRVHHNDTAFDVSLTFRDWPLLQALAIVPQAGIFIHTNVRLPAGLDRALRTVLVTPSFHYMHHSAARADWTPADEAAAPRLDGTR